MRVGLTEETNAWFPRPVDQNVSAKTNDDSYRQIRQPLLFLLLVQVLLLREDGFALERSTFRDQLRDDCLRGRTFGLQLLDLVMLQCLIRGAVIAEISIILSGTVRRCLVYGIQRVQLIHYRIRSSSRTCTDLLHRLSRIHFVQVSSLELEVRSIDLANQLIQKDFILVDEDRARQTERFSTEERRSSLTVAFESEQFSFDRDK